MTNISSFPTLQTILKRVVKCDIKFQHCLYIKDSVIVNFNINSSNSLKRLLKQPKPTLSDFHDIYASFSCNSMPCNCCSALFNTQSAQQAQGKEHNTYIVTSWRQSNAPILLITTMALLRYAGYGRPCGDMLAMLFALCLLSALCVMNQFLF